MGTTLLLQAFSFLTCAPEQGAVPMFLIVGSGTFFLITNTAGAIHAIRRNFPHPPGIQVPRSCGALSFLDWFHRLKPVSRKVAPPSVFRPGSGEMERRALRPSASRRARDRMSHCISGHSPSFADCGCFEQLQRRLETTSADYYIISSNGTKWATLRAQPYKQKPAPIPCQASRITVISVTIVF